jgi:hypothetical protein
MAKAITARMQGDDYQARWFWIQVCRLFADRSKVTRVAYEKDNVKSFDDVAVYYGDEMFDEEGYALSADYYQVKFHVAAAGAFTCEGMMDPAFINASTFSILHRLKNAQQCYAPDGVGCRFILYTPWSIHPDNPIAQIYSLTDGRIIWERLADGGPRSQMGKIRTAWRTHLGINTDEELRLVLRPLRIFQGPTLIQLQNTLNDKLRLAGLVPVDDGLLSHPYDELTRKLLQTGRTELMRADIEDICKRERLWVGHRMPEPDAYRVGIRSFLRWAEHLEDETDAMLCLLKYFDGRKIKSPELWQSQALSELSQFISATFRGHQRYHLHLHTHSSLAFAAGYCLDSKAGVDVAPIQATSAGREIWRPDTSIGHNADPTWTFTEEFVSDSGLDTVIALSVTHNVLEDVRTYASQSLHQVRRIISCIVPPGPSNQAVRDGTHAKLLANQLAAYFKTSRTNKERQGQLHIFAAAPNALVFFLGQLARSFGSCILYEYAFETNALGAYQPSLSFPPTASTGS